MLTPTPDQYNFSFDYCAMALFALSAVLYYITRGAKTRQNRIFITMEVLGFFSALFDIWGASCIARAHEIPFSQLYMTNLLYHLFHISSVLFYSYYVLIMFNLHRRLHWAVMVVFYTPTLFMMGLVVTNYWTKGVFYFDEDLKYQHGPAIVIMYGLSILYLLLMLIIQLAFRKALTKGILACMVALDIGVVGAIIFQSMNQDMLIELFVEAMTLLCFMFATKSADEIYDMENGLKNRASFVKDLNIVRYTRSDGEMISVKVSSVSFYHSKLGTAFRNEISRQIAGWFRTFLKEEELYSIGAGNYAIMLMGVRAGLAEQVIEKITDRFNKNWDYENFSIKLVVQTVNFDLSEIHKSVDDVISMIESPYEGTYDMHNVSGRAELNKLKRERDVQDAMSRAFRENLFRVYLQPIYNCYLQRVDGAEALVRIDDPALGLVMPQEFIPAAERSGFIADIGIWVMREACRFYRDASLSHFGIDRICFNLSEIQFLDRELPDHILETVTEMGIEPSKVCFEITEAIVSRMPEKMAEHMKRLAQYGFVFALDNYGFHYLPSADAFDLPFSIVKIDKSMLWMAQKKKNAGLRLSGTIRMLQEMQVKIVVEGVETTEQIELLEPLSPDYLQGYYFSKPLEEMRFMAYINATGAL